METITTRYPDPATPLPVPKTRQEKIRDFLIAASKAPGHDASVVEAVKRGLRIVHANQTADERGSKSTKHQNGKGWSGFDAEFGSAMAIAAEQGKTFSLKMVQKSAKLLSRYARQIAEATPE